MPYIKPEDRAKVDPLIEPLVKYLQGLPTEEQDGNLNYTITKIIKQVYPEKYFHYNRAIGVLEAAKLELYRHVVGPYEDQKIKDYGDV